MKHPILLIIIIIMIAVYCCERTDSEKSDSQQKSTEVDRHKKYEIVIQEKTFEDFEYKMVYKVRCIEPLNKSYWHTYYKSVTREQYDYYQEGETYYDDHYLIGY